MTFNLRVRTILDGPNIWIAVPVRAWCNGFAPSIPTCSAPRKAWPPWRRSCVSSSGDYTFFGVGRSDGKRRGEMCGVFFKDGSFPSDSAGSAFMGFRSSAVTDDSLISPSNFIRSPFVVKNRSFLCRAGGV